MANSIKSKNGNSHYVQKMRAKLFDIEARKLISIIHEADAKELGILPLDRIEIYCPKTKKRVTTVADLTTTMVKKNEIGLFKDVSRELGIKKCNFLEVKASPQPESVAFIKKKMKGENLSFEEISEIVHDIGKNKLDEIEISAFMAAVYIHGFDLDETTSMTKALLLDGKQLKIDKTPVVDKHCIGGINGRATMIVVPIVAAAGCYIPKTSSRAVTSCAGTADAMEVLAPVNLSIDKIKSITEKIGGVIVWGGAVDLAPVDDKIIKIEHPLALDPEGQIIASVVSKKASVGAKYVVFDLPVGPDVKIQTRERAENLAKKFVEVGKKMGMKVEALITDGTEPSGKAFGPALEAKYVMEILEGKRFDNLAQKSCELAGALLELCGKAQRGKGFAAARALLANKKALEKMKQIIKAQGGKILSSEDTKLAKFKHVVRAKGDGTVKSINVRLLSTIARIAGAPADRRAGVMLLVSRGEKLKPEQPLFEIYAENMRKLELAGEFAKKNSAVETGDIVLEKFQ